MPIPFSTDLRVDRQKVIDYLLNPSKSRGKAEFFLRFGFRVDAWETMAAALKNHARIKQVVSVVDSEFGKRYSVDGTLETPSGRQPQVRTVWIQDAGANELRLITAHPI
jgi:hypothetical protein